MSDPTYTVLIALEADEPDDPPYHGTKTTWWVVDNFHERSEAEDLVSQINDQIHSMTGINPARLED